MPSLSRGFGRDGPVCSRLPMRLSGKFHASSSWFGNTVLLEGTERAVVALLMGYCGEGGWGRACFTEQVAPLV